MAARAWDMAVTPSQGWGGYWDRFTWAFSPGYNIVGLRPWKRLRSFLDARLVGFDSHIRVCTDLSLENRARGAECDSPGWSGAKARVTRSKEYLQAGKAVAQGHCLTRLLPLAPRCWVDERAEADKNADAPFAHIANIHKKLRCARRAPGRVNSDAFEFRSICHPPSQQPSRKDRFENPEDRRGQPPHRLRQ